MTKPPSPHDDARRERLSAALRENLKRRKAQAKSRAQARAAQGTAEAAEGETPDENVEAQDGS